MIENLQYLSIVVEVAIAAIAFFAAFKKRKTFAYGLALTFAIYVFYDLAKLVPFNVPELVLYPMFFVASLSALWVSYKIYRG